MSIYKTDVVAIKKRMAEKKIDTIVELSERSGIHRNTLAKVLKEEAQPSSDTMEKLVFALEFSPQEAGCVFFGLHLRHA